MELIHWTDPLLWTSAFFMLFGPLIWNILAQTEYYHHSLTQLFCGHKKIAIIALAFIILLLNYLRSTVFNLAIESQPKFPLSHPVLFIISIVLVGFGQLLVWASFYRLGFYPTFLADYFGVFIHDAPITSFPFSVCNDPMYFGSAVTHFGVAIAHSSPAGLLLSAFLSIVYKLAISQEGKMLQIIYSKKAH